MEPTRRWRDPRARCRPERWSCKTMMRTRHLLKELYFVAIYLTIKRIKHKLNAAKSIKKNGIRYRVDIFHKPIHSFNHHRLVKNLLQAPSGKCHLRLSRCQKLRNRLNNCHIRWVVPLPRMPVTTRTIPFFVGNPELNLHL